MDLVRPRRPPPDRGWRLRNLPLAYDLGSRLTQILWPDGFYATYGLDTLGEITKLTEKGAVSGRWRFGSVRYDNLGDRISLTRGNGVNTTYGYDAAFRAREWPEAFGSSRRRCEH